MTSATRSHRTRVHYHKCATCGEPVECFGIFERNYDGWPEAICADYHLPNGLTNPQCLCDGCREKSNGD